ncbi:MAG TPA: hypothetical protein VLL08_14685 [Kineosporiaceae bacterium]|nr:hypothetical protein [Kineosporiaceae bacterium]
MSNAIRSVLAALACSEVEIPRASLRGLKGVVPTGTAPFAVLLGIAACTGHPQEG